jgi:hypothetical protein
MLLVIINHGQNQAAIALKAAFAPHTEVLAIDSGSNLSPDERSHFDLTLPNVYYCGLLNAAAHASRTRPADEVIYFWSSDVSYDSPARALASAAEAFTDSRTGTYAPSAWFSGHRQMWNKQTGKLRRVSFVEGFCFATRAGLLRELCPIDTNVNAMGWGIDMQLGFLTLRRGQRSVVDDRIEVKHPQSTGYSTLVAKQQRTAWLATLPSSVRRFHRIAGWTWTKRRPFQNWFRSWQW